jgi:L-seryl-tRNA(Ser) seleniumtransferase
MSASDRNQSPFLHLGVPEVINAVGYATRVGGSSPAPEVVQAMAEACGPFVEIDDLQAAASRVIAHHTGAEAGIVTCGAAAALSLASAACLVGNDPDRMDELPDVSHCSRFEIVHPRPYRFGYDHALRLAGARLVIVDYTAADGLSAIARAIGSRTAAVAFVCADQRSGADLAGVIACAHRHHVPVIVDASIALPPAENLRAVIAAGADLVAYSGGKHLGGPQASGFLCGRANLVRSAWAQMVDMDVRPGTWSLQGWLDAGWISRPPRNGIGRSMKVGKETIVGLLTALELYARRDHAAEQARWRSVLDEIAAGLANVRELGVEVVSGPSRRFPLLRIASGAPPAGLSVRRLLTELRRQARKVILIEDDDSLDLAYVSPVCLSSADGACIVSAIRSVVAVHRRERPA